MNDLVVTEALEWIGTPYRHQHSTKGVGTDCLGVLRGVYRNVIGPEPEQPPNYSPSWGEADRREVLLIAADRHLTRVVDDDRQPGDALIFRMRRGMIAKHCGIMVTGGRFVHAYQGIGHVEATVLDDYWIKKLAGVFRYPEVI